MDNNVCQILGNNLKHIRKAKGLKQDELAEIVGLEIKSLSLIETGKGFVSAKTLEKLSKVLNVQISELFEVLDIDSENIYESIISNLKLIRNNSAKLKTVNMVLKSLI